MTENNNKNKIIVGISGGVDSSVAAMLLKEKGYDVEALFMKNWNDQTEDGKCLWEDDVEDAMQVCDKLDIPLNTVDLSKDYWEKVFKNFLAEYKVFLSNEAIVIGPTPPGTGVIKEVLCCKLSKSVSPINLYPLLVNSDGTL